MEELEAEILVEVSRFGEVCTLATYPESAYYFGSCVVVFAEVGAAQACGEVMDGRSFADGFIQVQALGNWGDGEIVPPPQPVPLPGGEDNNDDDGDETGREAETAPGPSQGGGGELDALDDFFSTVGDLETPGGETEGAEAEGGSAEGASA